MQKQKPYWVELRVHGVSGTLPEDMLDNAHVRQVAGDSLGRVFRPTDSAGRDQHGQADHILEGYHWGQFTSGSWRMGLWLVLIPFGFVNAAAFMLPPIGKKRMDRVLHAVVGGLIRSIGIGLTCTFALMASLICVDLVAWQAAARFEWLAWAPNGPVMAFGLLAAALIVLGLSRLGNQSRDLPAPEASSGSLAEHKARGLSRPRFYAGQPDAPILSRLHLAAGLAVVALVGALSAERISADRLGSLSVPVAIALVVATSAITTFLGDPERSVSGSRAHAWHQSIAEPLSVVLVGLAWTLVAVCAWAFTGTDRRPLPLSFDAHSRWLSVSMAVVVFALLVTNALLAWRSSDNGRRDFRRYARGLAPWAAATAGLSLGVGYSGAFVLGAARALDARVESELLYRIAYSWGLSFALIAALLMLCLGYALVKRRQSEPETRAAYAVLDGPPVAPKHLRCVPDEWYKRVAFACGIAKVKNTIPVVFVTTAAVSLVMTLVTGVEMFFGELPQWVGWVSSASREPAAVASTIIDVGNIGLIAAAGWMLILGRRSLRNQQTRRGVNVIWDVVSFWPHSAHPFVPPAYSQFAVRELLDRIRFHLGSADAQPDRGPAECVVVAAHSQGSLIAFAAALWLGDDDITRVGLVTYGSQLQVAFPRAFPAYVNDGLIEKLYRRLDGRWVNLYRETDPIAGPVLSWKETKHATRRTSFSEPAGDVVGSTIELTTGRRESGNDWRLLDPAPADRGLQRGAVVKMCRHSAFPISEDWQAAVDAVRPHPPAPDVDIVRQPAHRREVPPPVDAGVRLS